MEQSSHPSLAATERAALRTARSSARADGSSGSAGCGAELFMRERRGRAPRRMEQSSHPSLAAAERAALRSALHAPSQILNGIRL